MISVLIILAIVVAGGLIYLATREGRYEIHRSLLMNVDRQAVFDKIRDFRSWPEWSPWLMHEPDAKLEYSDDPDQEEGWYTWDGQRIGAGRLTHVRLDAPDRIDQRIEFIRPFKSVSSVWWELEDQDGATRVTWCMRGTMPFFLRFMTPMMMQMIAKDYGLGLAMLRGRLEPEAERPVIDFVGETMREPTSALTTSFKGGIDDLGPAMQEAFPKLAAHVEQSGGKKAGCPFTAYHKADVKAMYFECDMAIRVGDDVPDGEYERKTLGGGKYFKVTAQGSYDFLELAWYSAMSHLQMLKRKMDDSRPSLEVYENDPESVSHTNEIMTTIYIPIR